MEKPKKNPNRIAKVNSLIEHELGIILREYLQGQKGLTTIKKVETSRDMRWAKIWISILGADADQILGFINKNIYHIQGELNKKFATKIIPRIQFFLDTSGEYAQHIDELITSIHKESRTNPQEPNKKDNLEI
ncbi:MAG: ribosome-binding factor A [Candidatus Doudnabacteria bacterium CG10_big_fil_rev_8_21_14_0_10_42_18]|uniref:Ribosome-binding factor A n=1 Tax=Candidatus Doudnabacteria bacterium CG10_big_fil_rev_8_21_14_0_10_42_18 TaxID=1974552 RepID=A0A2H0VAR5_9BACT|nr:MAG: ribosome-binding factor A [Candidatus Doudnabacteria bacterium CG10_big_fil_rev_8_21_14_0_10_42_18]